MAPLGLTEAEVRDHAVEVEIPDSAGQPLPLWVMHPEHCLESRVANIVVLGKTSELAFGQLRASVACTRLFSVMRLDEGAIREALDVNERVFGKCLHDRAFDRVRTEHGIDPFDAVLLDDRLGKFVDIRYPQMVRLLSERRGRS